MVDIRIIDQGSVIGFMPESDVGKDWLTEHLPDDCPALGKVMYCQARYADPIIAGMVDEGLNVV